MKNNRRRRHLRPRPSRAQITQQLQHVASNMRLFQAEWLLEAALPQPSQARLRFLHDAIVAMRDELESLEAM